MSSPSWHLANAWRTGAASRNSAKRVAFANDPLAVTATANQAGGDGDAAT